MKWWHDSIMFIFNLLMLSIFYYFIGIDAVILYGFARVLTEIWKRELD